MLRQVPAPPMPYLFNGLMENETVLLPLQVISSQESAAADVIDALNVAPSTSVPNVIHNTQSAATNTPIGSAFASNINAPPSTVTPNYTCTLPPWDIPNLTNVAPPALSQTPVPSQNSHFTLFQR